MCNKEKFLQCFANCFLAEDSFFYKCLLRTFERIGFTSMTFKKFVEILEEEICKSCERRKLNFKLKEKNKKGE